MGPAKTGESRKVLREGRAGQWREVLSRCEVRKIVKAHHRQMARYGYLSDDLLTSSDIVRARKIAQL